MLAIKGRIKTQRQKSKAARVVLSDDESMLNTTNTSSEGNRTGLNSSNLSLNNQSQIEIQNENLNGVVGNGLGLGRSFRVSDAHVNDSIVKDADSQIQTDSENQRAPDSVSNGVFGLGSHSGTGAANFNREPRNDSDLSVVGGGGGGGSADDPGNQKKRAEGSGQAGDGD